MGPAARAMPRPPRALPRVATAPRLALLDAAAGALALVVAMQLRFLDEGGVPPSYASRILPWVGVGVVLQVGLGILVDRLRAPRGLLAGRTVSPFLAAGLLGVGLSLAASSWVAPLPLRLPTLVAILAPLLAVGISAAGRLAGTRSAAQEVNAEALLPRPAVQLDVAACAPALRDRRVLITGAAGSIGAELARQALRVGPAAVLLLDTNETGLYEVEAALARGAADVPVKALMADVSDADRLLRLFREERPEVVFHAAAYKHVPLVEANPEQGFAINVLGTLAVCRAAQSVGSERVVVISTDKAVRPASFYGYTKRTAELLVAALGERTTSTTLSAVRFVNVLGSRGSVVPTLLRQIEQGGPVTITDPAVQRYFMTISEAASLVLRTAAFGDPGAIFVLDMGEELRIEELAERLVRLKGLRPHRDVPFVYTGLRPGEKLREELLGEGESFAPTAHPHVRRVQASYAVDSRHVLDVVDRLAADRREGRLRAADYALALRALIADAVRRPAGAVPY